MPEVVSIAAFLLRRVPCSRAGQPGAGVDSPDRKERSAKTGACGPARLVFVYGALQGESPAVAGPFLPVCQPRAARPHPIDSGWSAFHLKEGLTMSDSQTTPLSPLGPRDLLAIQEATERLASKGDAFRAMGTIIRDLAQDHAAGSRIYELVDSLAGDVQRLAIRIRQVTLPHLIQSTHKQN